MSTSLPICDIDPLARSRGLSDSEISVRIAAVKERLGERLLILGHHYQRDSIIEHADLTGDSFLLSKMAAESSSEFIVFCGVHFMAESADILSRDNQVVVLPNLRAGCSMADMANVPDVEQCWYELLERFDIGDPQVREDPTAPATEGEAFLVPVTYMNSSAELKAFVGRHGGVVCTSSNAEGVLDWAFQRAGNAGKVLFFPDQHLGRNTGIKMGIEPEKMLVWTPNAQNDWEGLKLAQIVLWHGFCSVHRRFTVEQITRMRTKHPSALIVVHPECIEDVVQAADAVGSTEFIRRYVEDAPSGSIIGVGTEINMVNRLDQIHKDKDIRCLDEMECPCSTMYMIHPVYLLDVLERLEGGDIPNRIVVEEPCSSEAALALDRMLSIPK